MSLFAFMKYLGEKYMKLDAGGLSYLLFLRAFQKDGCFYDFLLSSSITVFFPKT